MLTKDAIKMLREMAGAEKEIQDHLSATSSRWITAETRLAALKVALDNLNSEPRANAWWVLKDGFLICSGCQHAGIFDYKYCPVCGAKMDR